MTAPDQEPIDLVDALNTGRISRRDFMRRGMLLGLSVPTLAGILAACGDDDDTADEATGADTGAATSGDETTGTTAAPTGTTGAPAAGGSIRVATQKPAAALDPIAMQDLGSYGVIAQCFEFLATLGDDGTIAPGLAESWEPNADGSVWTFASAPGRHVAGRREPDSPRPTWPPRSTGSQPPTTPASRVSSVRVRSTPPIPPTAVVTLLSPNGNFPYLVSVFNAQAVITPVAYATGTTLDAQPNGTGPWKLASFDPATGAEFTRNDAYWGGAPPLESTSWSFFDDEGAMVTAAAAGEVDTLVQFQVVGGEALFDNPDFNVVGFPAATHRQIWMRCDTGQFADKRVRQALGLSIDRPALIETLFKGQADLGNDHVIAPVYPFFDASVPQRERDIDAAKQLLADAGFPDGMSAVLHFGKLQEIPELAQLIQAQAAEAGFTLELAGESLDTFYGAQWCPAEPADPPCSGAAELGIVDYGHRATPDVYLNAALSTGGIWGSSQYSSPEFDAAFAAYQSAIGLEAQTAACKTIEEILVEDTPVVIPYFYNYISGWSTKFADIKVSALGQIFLDKAAQVA